MKYTLSVGQLNALRVFAHSNGRSWKFKLNHAWSTGRYRDYSVSETYGGDNVFGHLQMIRNTFGPSWLVKFNFSNLKTHSVEH